MKEEDFSKLVDSIQEAGQIKGGKKKASRVYKIDPPSIKAVREKLHVSQNEFALMIGVSKSTLQNWEQGRRTPVASQGIAYSSCQESQSRNEGSTLLTEMMPDKSSNS